MEFKRESRVTWTNWTFGFWWGKIGTTQRRGLDLGPLEIMWTEKKPSVQSRITSQVKRDILANKERRRPQPGEYPKPVTRLPGEKHPRPVRPDLTGRRDELRDLRDNRR